MCASMGSRRAGMLASGRTMRLQLLPLLFLFLLVCIADPAQAFLVRVPSHNERCFQETVRKGDKVAGSMHVVSGGSLDIDLRILDPSNRVVFEQPRRSEESFTFFAGESGAYSFCFSNSMSMVSSKLVSFSIYSGSRLHEHDAAGSAHVTPLETSVRQLAEGIREVDDWNNFMKSRERVHHDTVISTNRRVVVWRSIQMTALIAVALAKVWYLRHLFEAKRGA